MVFKDKTNGKLSYILYNNYIKIDGYRSWWGMKFKIDRQTETILLKNGFRKTKNNSLYKTVKKLKNKVIKVRIANHFNYINKNNEILINYVYKNKYDIKKLVKRLFKNNIIEELNIN